MNKYSFCFVLSAVVLGISQGVNAADNLRMHGALVHEACDILPGDESQTLDLGAMPEKFFYLNTRTPGRDISINLINCDTSIGNMVTLSFSGTENSKLPGHLAFGAGSTAKGVAIGIETPEGKLLPLNDITGETYPIINGTNVLKVKAYLKGEPDALANQEIEPGNFRAETFFNLDYY